MTEALLTCKDIKLFIENCIRKYLPTPTQCFLKKQICEKLGISIYLFNSCVKKGLRHKYIKGKRYYYYLPYVLTWLNEHDISYANNYYIT